MGVRGLSSFFDCNPHLTRSHKLHDCKVVIDGNNLVHFLYFSNKLDCVYGGDYYKFANVVRNHLFAYLECNIKPIIVFDGGYDPSDRKLRTIFERTKRRLTNVHHIAKYGHCSEKVLPILATEVAKDVLRDMGIAFVQCDYEADEQLVLLANRYKCPVISQDSDFYIFDISHGFIRLDFIESDVFEDDTCEHKLKYRKCQIYMIDYFLSLFDNLDKSLLPLFSTLIGNDISHISTFDEFFNNIKLPKFKGNLKVSPRHKKMIGLLSWLQNRTLEESVKQVLSHLKLKKREQIKILIERVINSYNADCCIVLEDCEDVEQNSFQSDIKTYHGKTLPLWFIKSVRSCEISPFLLNAIILHRNFLPSQVEDMSLESSFKCSSKIRRIIYSILLNYDVDASLDYHNFVEEYDRRSGTLQKEPVVVIPRTKDCDTLPPLSTFNTLDINYKKIFLSRVMDDDLEYFLDVPERFRLLFGCIRYWLKNTCPKPPIEVLNTFILTNILFSIVIPYVKQDIRLYDEIDTSNDLQNLIASVDYSEASLFYNNMKKYFQKPQYSNANPIIFRIIHFFCQLQTCALSLTYLNRLLFSPFENLRLECFNGTIFYNLTKDLMNRSSVELFISQLLGRSSNLNNLYIKMKNKITENISEDCLIKQSCKSKKVNKKTCSKMNESVTDKLRIQLENLDLIVDPDVDVLL